MEKLREQRGDLENLAGSVQGNSCSGLCMTSSVKWGESLTFSESRLLFLDGAEPSVSTGVE